jgi:NitT/TauT family transport system permease protein
MTPGRIALFRIALVVAAGAALEVLCRTGVISPLTIVPPTQMAAKLYDLLASGLYADDLWFTLINTVWAAALSIVLGIGLGACIQALPRLRRALDPILTAYYAVPTFVFYPVLVVLFGLNRIPLVLIGAMFGVVAMIVNTMDGLDRIPRAFVKTARVLHMGRVATTFRIQLPAASPHLFTGLKLAVTYSVIGVIAGEFILSGAGLGRRIAFAYNDLDNQTMYALLLLMLAAIILIYAAVRHWESSVHRRWRQA